jgi:hypothetical protein
MMFKTILGYEIEDGVSPVDYEQWLFEVHAPDLLANPYLDRLVLNKVLRPVTVSSGGSADVPVGYTFYRIAEMHFADEAAYESYRKWFENNPIPAERGPAGRTKFKFYVAADSTEVTREGRPGAGSHETG